MTDKPETVADVLADMKNSGWSYVKNWAARIERAASAVPVAINTHNCGRCGRGFTPDDADETCTACEYIGYGTVEVVGTPAVPNVTNSRLYHAVNLMMAVVCSEGEIRNRTKETEAVMAALAEIDGGTYAPAVPVESLGRDAPDPVPLNAVRAAIEAVDTGRTQIARDNLRILEIHLRAQSEVAAESAVDDGLIDELQRACETPDGVRLQDHAEPWGCDVRLLRRAIAAMKSEQIHTSPPPASVPDGLLAATRRLAFAARTSGGTAGHDAELCAALDAIEAILATTPEESP